MLIQTNGLGAALAFVKAKGSGSNDESKAYHLLYQHVGMWLTSDANAYLLASSEANSSDLVEQVIGLDSTMYRATTREVMTLLNWLRRLADGFIVMDDE
jgi:CRISPR type III-B/RAMP module-associated protein Cmr5